MNAKTYEIRSHSKDEKISSKIALNSCPNAKNNQATKPYTIRRLPTQAVKLNVNLQLVNFLCDYVQD